MNRRQAHPMTRRERRGQDPRTVDQFMADELRRPSVWAYGSFFAGLLLIVLVAALLVGPR